jgi:hypothetical protein
MPFYQVFIRVDKDVDPNEYKYMKYKKDENRCIEIKKHVEGFNLVFDLFVDCNDDGELGTVFNIHCDPTKVNEPLTSFFDSTEYTLSSEEIGLKVNLSIVLVDKEAVPFTHDISTNILGFCITIKDYAKKIKKIKDENALGIVYEKSSSNVFFETNTVIVLHKQCGSCTS